MCNLTLIHFLRCNHWRFYYHACFFHGSELLCRLGISDGIRDEVCPQCRRWTSPPALVELEANAMGRSFWALWGRQDKTIPENGGSQKLDSLEPVSQLSPVKRSSLGESESLGARWEAKGKRGD